MGCYDLNWCGLHSLGNHRALAAEFMEAAPPPQGRRAPMSKPSLQPRIIRAKQAPGYLGMCLDVFNRVVRPHVNEFPIGRQGVGFDRIELDKWTDAYIAEKSIKKLKSAEEPPLLTGTPQSERSKRGPARHGQISGLSTHKPPTSEDFYKLVDQLMGRSGVKKDPRRHRQIPPPVDE